MKKLDKESMDKVQGGWLPALLAGYALYAASEFLEGFYEGYTGKA
jgi:hypothetical protein